MSRARGLRTSVAMVARCMTPPLLMVTCLGRIQVWLEKGDRDRVDVVVAHERTSMGPGRMAWATTILTIGGEDGVVAPNLVLSGVLAGLGLQPRGVASASATMSGMETVSLVLPDYVGGRTGVEELRGAAEDLLAGLEAGDIHEDSVKRMRAALRREAAEATEESARFPTDNCPECVYLGRKWGGRRAGAEWPMDLYFCENRGNRRHPMLGAGIVAQGRVGAGEASRMSRYSWSLSVTARSPGGVNLEMFEWAEAEAMRQGLIPTGAIEVTS